MKIMTGKLLYFYVLSLIIGNLANFMVVKNSETCPDDNIPITVEILTIPYFPSAVSTPLWQLQEISSHAEPIMLGTNSTEPLTTYQESACLPYGYYSFQLFTKTSHYVMEYTLKSKSYILKTAFRPFTVGYDDIKSSRTFPFKICKQDSECPADSCADAFCNKFGFCANVTNCSKCGKKSAKVSVMTDNRPSDTSWVIKSASDGETVAENPRYFEKEQIHEQIVCLETAKTYEFAIYDIGVNGYFTGWYSLSLNNSTNIFEKKGYFSGKEVTEFGLCEASRQCNYLNPCSDRRCDLRKSVCVQEKKPCAECLRGYNPCDQDQDSCIPSSCQECGEEDFLLQVTTTDLSSTFYYTLTEGSTNNVIETGSFSLGRYTQHEQRHCLQQRNSYLFTLASDKEVIYADHSLFVNNNLHTKVSAPTSWKQSQIRLCTNSSDCEAFDSCSVPFCDRSRRLCIKRSKSEFTQECRTYGSPSILVIRVITTDRETTTASHEISDYVFGTFGRSFSMKSQLSACSYDKFNIIPFQGITSTGIIIENGVIDIEISINTAGEQVGTVSNKVFEEAQNLLGDLESQFDFVMICLPPDTLLGDSSNWKAYAYVNSYQSVYNDLACNYPSVQIHELGHNLGLSHSNDEENYGDLSGYMGASYSLVDGPRKCFNGVKSWQLGWYQDRHLVLDANTIERARTLSIFGISDYADLTSTNDYHIVKIINCGDGFDYYVAFNRQDGIQSETSEGVNKLLVTKRTTGLSYDDSFLESRLSSNEAYGIKLSQQKNYTTLQIFPEMKSNNGKEYAEVKISLHAILCTSDTACDDSNTCTVDQCSHLECTHILKSCDECGGLVKVRVKSNNHPQNIFWSVLELNQGTVMLVNELYDEPYIEYSKEKCLMYGKYIFSIFYSANNSLSEGEVEYSLSVGHTIMENNTISFETFYESVFVICAADADCNDYFGCSVDVCNHETNLCDNYIDESLASCKNCTWLNINITTDNFPEETSWELYDKANNVLITSGDPYPFDFGVAYGRRKAPTRSGRRKAPTRAGRRKAPTRASSLASDKYISDLNYNAMEIDDDSVFEELCLSSNILFRFSIFDSFGDGICCTEGTGSYTITLNNFVALHGGNFGDSDNLLFQITNCIDSSQCNSEPCAIGTCDSNIGICTYSPLLCAECGALIKVNIMTDFVPLETSWAIFRESELILKRDSFSTAFKLYQESVCLSYGEYNFVVYDVAGDGMVSCDGPVNVSCGYIVNVNDVIIFEGNVDSLYEEKNYLVICKEDKHCDDSDPCTVDRCNVTNRICVFDQIPCAYCSMASLEVIVNTDNFPFETRWELVNDITKELVMYGGPYSKKHFQYSKVRCVKEGLYTFNIIDEDGGLCDEFYSNWDPNFLDDYQRFLYDDSYFDYTCGNYSIRLNNEIFHQGSSFEDIEITSFEIMKPTSFPSMFPSASPKSSFEEWLLNFQQVSKYSQNNTEIFLLEYRISKEKTIMQITAKILDDSCSDIIESNVITMGKKELTILENEANDSFSISLRLNKTSLRETSVWKKTSPSKGNISFCVRIDLNLKNVSVSFEETKISILTNLLASTFEVENINVEKYKTSSTDQVAEFELSSCICDGLNNCLDKATVTQNSLMRICVFPANEMIVEAFVNVIFYQDRIAKFIAIEQEKQSKLVSVTGGAVGILETRAISSFFDEPSPAPVFLGGEVKMSFLDHRVLTTTKKKYYKQASFETEIKMKKRHFGKLSTVIMLILTTIFVTAGINFYFSSPYLALRTEEC